jgi:uncharacterized protein YeaO (DUF488 family)
MIKLKRAYEEPSKEDGFRILVERLWPRGVTKERARIDLWLKDISPSAELRTWYSHDVAKWPQFRERYYAELKTKKDLITVLKQKIKEGPVTFVFAARDEEHNSALALKSFIENS